MAAASPDQMDGFGSGTPAGGVNLRDIAVTDPSRVRPGLVYRSSDTFGFDEVHGENVASALDLREEPPGCKRLMRRQLLSSVFKAPFKSLPDRTKPTSMRSQPVACDRCSKRLSDLHERKISVHHVNLLPPRMKLRIFADMPWSVRLCTAIAPLKGKSPKGVIEPRVGDPETLPFDMLYRQMLGLSKRPIAKALRIFARSENLPVVIHCSQGRDRTGIITALLLRALGTDADAVALDYADSDINLQEQDDKEEGVDFDEGKMRQQTVPPNVRVMKRMLAHLDEHYGGITSYLHHIGISADEIRSIQRNLLQPTAKTPVASANGNCHNHAQD